MSERIIVYVSSSTIPPECADAEIKDLVAGARGRNAALGLTSVLLSTETYFAQALEGEAAMLSPVLDSIRCDPRHKEVSLLVDAPIARRRFGPFPLAYWPCAMFVERIIGRAIQDADQAVRGGVQLIKLMEDFARQTPGGA